MSFIDKIFPGRNIKNKNYIYLDNAGATPVSLEVAKKIKEVEGLYANPSSIFCYGVKTKEKLQEARKSVANIINSLSSEIIWTSTGTESNNMALIGFVTNYIFNNNGGKIDKLNKPKVITSNIEHSSVLEPLLNLKNRGFIELEYLEADETGVVRVNDLRDVLQRSGEENIENIILVSLMYANNETGSIQKVKEIGRVIEQYNQKLNQNNPKVAYHIDACQAANYLDLDVRKLRCSMMSVNSSKVYGPKGVAFLYKNKNIILDPIVRGGGQESELRSGTENIQGIVGLAEALKEAKLKRDDEIKRLLLIQNYFFENIQKEIKEAVIYTKINDISRIVDNKNNSINYFNLESLPNNINIGLPNIGSDEMVIRLDSKGFEVSHKSSCASHEIAEGSHVIFSMTKNKQASNENIRISMGRYTKLEDIVNLIRNIKEIYYKYKR
ncbi:MAG: cysteine desulfurase [Patescibacteria group bacterium]|nr:cysteine desulfurase [Patescibacteria group bacterium]